MTEIILISFIIGMVIGIYGGITFMSEINNFGEYLLKKYYY